MTAPVPRVVRAARDHNCDACGFPIPAGARYVRTLVLVHGSHGIYWSRYAYHAETSLCDANCDLIERMMDAVGIPRGTA